MFYTFTQNNSGGFDIRNDYISEYVIVEGDDYSDIIHRALDVGIYFNGVRENIDCECCGDRWSKPSDDDDLDTVPAVYGKSVKPLVDKSNTSNVVIHYQNGSRKYGTYRYRLQLLGS